MEDSRKEICSHILGSIAEVVDSIGDMCISIRRITDYTDEREKLLKIGASLDLFHQMLQEICDKIEPPKSTY